VAGTIVKIGIGRTAETYATEQGTALKLFYDFMPADTANYEYAVSKKVADVCPYAPACLPSPVSTPVQGAGAVFTRRTDFKEYLQKSGTGKTPKNDAERRIPDKPVLWEKQDQTHGQECSQNVKRRVVPWGALRHQQAEFSDNDMRAARKPAAAFCAVQETYSKETNRYYGNVDKRKRP
jgi:hypothetical protein